MSVETVAIGASGPTPLGEIWLAVGARGLIAVDFPTSQEQFTRKLEQGGRAVRLSPEAVEPFGAQICAYLAATLREFSLPIDWETLNDFQRAALKATFAIPYGETRTYGVIAAQIGHPGAARAVGRAQATNPMPLVLPCHRVLGADGKLRGYGAGAGLETKTWLLRLERGG